MDKATILFVLERNCVRIFPADVENLSAYCLDSCGFAARFAFLSARFFRLRSHLFSRGHIVGDASLLGNLLRKPATLDGVPHALRHRRQRRPGLAAAHRLARSGQHRALQGDRLGARGAQHVAIQARAGGHGLLDLIDRQTGPDVTVLTGVTVCLYRLCRLCGLRRLYGRLLGWQRGHGLARVLEALDRRHLVRVGHDLREALALQLRGEAGGRVGGLGVGQDAAQDRAALLGGLLLATVLDATLHGLEFGVQVGAQQLGLVERLLVFHQFGVGRAQLLGLHEILEGLVVLGVRGAARLDKLLGLELGRGRARRDVALGESRSLELRGRLPEKIGRAGRLLAALRRLCAAHGEVRAVLEVADERFDVVHRARPHQRVDVRIARLGVGREEVARGFLAVGRIAAQRAQERLVFSEGLDALQSRGVFARCVGGDKARSGRGALCRCAGLPKTGGCIGRRGLARGHSGRSGSRCRLRAGRGHVRRVGERGVRLHHFLRRELRAGGDRRLAGAHHAFKQRLVEIALTGGSDLAGVLAAELAHRLSGKRSEAAHGVRACRIGNVELSLERLDRRLVLRRAARGGDREIVGAVDAHALEDAALGLLQAQRRAGDDRRADAAGNAIHGRHGQALAHAFGDDRVAVLGQPRLEGGRIRDIDARFAGHGRNARTRLERHRARRGAQRPARGRAQQHANGAGCRTHGAAGDHARDRADHRRQRVGQLLDHAAGEARGVDHRGQVVLVRPVLVELGRRSRHRVLGVELLRVLQAIDDRGLVALEQTDVVAERIAHLPPAARQVRAHRRLVGSLLAVSLLERAEAAGEEAVRLKRHGAALLRSACRCAVPAFPQAYPCAAHHLGRARHFLDVGGIFRVAARLQRLGVPGCILAGADCATVAALD